MKSKMALFFGVTAAVLMICDLALAHHGSSVSYATANGYDGSNRNGISVAESPRLYLL